MKIKKANFIDVAILVMALVSVSFVGYGDDELCGVGNCVEVSGD